MGEANVLEKYAGLIPEKRVDYICKNFSRFTGIIERLYTRIGVNNCGRRFDVRKLYIFEGTGKSK